VPLFVTGLMNGRLDAVGPYIMLPVKLTLKFTKLDAGAVKTMLTIVPAGTSVTADWAVKGAPVSNEPVMCT